MFVTAALTSVLPPILLAFVVRPLTLGLFNYLPAGPTPIIFAILAQYHAMVPHLYRYKVATSTTPRSDGSYQGLTFSDKSYRYVLAGQLALAQWPGSLLGALTGWVVGYAWRMEALPRALTRWRLPAWVVGLRAPRRSEEFEGMRRRLEVEGEGAGVGGGAPHPAAMASGVQSQGLAPEGAEGAAGRRRTMGQQIMDQFRGAAT